MPDEVIEVHAPNGGLVDTVQIDLLRGSEAQAMLNMHHDRLALERRQGKYQIGAPTPDLVCFGGHHYRLSDNTHDVLVRAQGIWQALADKFTYLYKSTGTDWRGAQSNGLVANALDIIGNGSGYGNGCFVQYADKLWFYDAGSLRRFFDFTTVREYGRFAGTELPAGTLVGSGGNGTGSGYSFTFNGSTHLSVGVTGINGATDYTFACWVKTTSTAFSGLVFAWGSGGGPSHEAGLTTEAGSGTQLESHENSTSVYASTFDPLINDGLWHHVAGVRFGNQGSIYIDGVLKATSLFTVLPLTATAMYIGGTRYGGAVGNGLTGSMDEVRFYSRALTQTELVLLCNGGQPDVTALKLWLKLDEGSGSTITDSSGVGNGGTVVGAGAWAVDSPNPVVGGGSTGHLQAGDYSFVYTYYNPTTAEESPPSGPSNTVNLGLADGIISATVPVNSAWNTSYGFTRIRWYRTTVDGATYFFEKETVALTLPQTTTLSVADEDLGAEADFSWGAVPRLRYAILFNEMVVAAGNPESPTTLYWSAIGDPMHWPPENAQDIDKDNGDPITGMFRLIGRLYVVKQTSGIYMLTPQFDSEGTVSFAVDPITSDFGCLSFHSICVIDTYAYWADAKGIVRFNGQQCENVSDPKIRYLWKTLASQIVIGVPSVAGFRAPALECDAVHDRQADHNYYRLNIRSYYQDRVGAGAGQIDGGHDTRIELIYDVGIGCWFTDSGQDNQGTNNGRDSTTGYSTVISWLYKDKQGQFHVIQGDETGRCYRLRTAWGHDDGDGVPRMIPVYADNLFPIYSQWKSRWWGGMDGVIPKWLEVEYERNEVVGLREGAITINLYRDGKTTPDVTDSTTIVPYDTGSPPPPLDSTLPNPTHLTHTVRIDWNAEWCRRFCFEIVCNAKNTALRILQFRIAYFPCGSSNKAK